MDWGGSAHRKRFGGDEFLVEEEARGQEESDYGEAVGTSWDGSSRRCWQAAFGWSVALCPWNRTEPRTQHLGKCKCMYNAYCVVLFRAH